jgi:ABC-type antimicrobial peptide transport system ATPase subunit
LHELVTEHNHWFFEKEDTDLVGLRDRFSTVALHDDPQISGVIKANRKACLAVEKTLDLLDSGQVVDFRVHKSHHYSVVIAQNVFLAKYLANSQKITTFTALRMEALSKRCWVINEMLQKQSEDGLPYVEVVLHVKRLLECLRKLRMELEAILE